MDNNIWTYRVYSQGTPPEFFGDFAPFVDLWLSKFEGNQLPEWKDFKLKEFAGWYGQLSLSQVAPDHSEMINILWGTVITEWWGVDYTGESMIPEDAPDHWKEIEGPYISKLHSSGGIGVCSGGLYLHERDFIQVTYVDFPLIYEGEASRVLSVYSRDSKMDGFDNVSPIYEYIERY